MAWWKWASIASVGYLILVIGIGVLHVDVLAGDISPEREDLLGERYGQVCGVGLGVIWGLTFFWSCVKPNPAPKIDRGFALNWWRMSPRRQFIREAWAGGICIAAIWTLQATGHLTNWLRDRRISDSPAAGWWVAAAATLLWSAWIAFLYRRWSRQTRLRDGAIVHHSSNGIETSAGSSSSE